MDLAKLVRDLSLTLIPFVLSLTVHEYAHAWVAHRLGDDTAKEQGRLTLNPQSHIDPLGTLLIPALGVLFGGVSFIAWAKPVPYRPERFREGVNRRLGAAMVAAAGPLSNLVLATVSLAVLAGLARANVPLQREVQDGARYVLRETPLALLLIAMFTRNIALAVFNLLPIPPLDGHYLLPPVFDPIVKPMARYGFAILMIGFVVFPVVGQLLVGRPIQWLTTLLLRLFGFN